MNTRISFSMFQMMGALLSLSIIAGCGHSEATINETAVTPQVPEWGHHVDRLREDVFHVSRSDNRLMFQGISTESARILFSHPDSASLTVQELTSSTSGRDRFLLFKCLVLYRKWIVPQDGELDTLTAMEEVLRTLFDDWDLLSHDEMKIVLIHALSDPALYRDYHGTILAFRHHEDPEFRLLATEFADRSM